MMIRIVFLIYIIGLLIYFIISNEKVEEKFDQQEDDIIKDVLKDLKLVLSDKLITFYTNYYKKYNISKENLKDIIKNSHKTFETVNTEYNNKSLLIDKIYNDVLLRNPTKQEMDYYVNLFNTDKSFNEEKLRGILIKSKEYERMIKTQDNNVYGDNMGKATDRQIEFIVAEVYYDVTNKKIDDQLLLDFLKKKFIDFDLNEKQLRGFITMYMQDKTYTIEREPVVIREESSVNIEDIKKQILEEVKQSLKKVEAKQQNEIFMSKGQCYTNAPKQDIAELQKRRNEEELKYSCLRGQKGRIIDDDLILEPSFAWSVPQRHPPVCIASDPKDPYPNMSQTALIGTLLN